MARHLIIFATLIFFMSDCFGSVVWSETAQQIKASQGQQTVTAIFKFIVRGGAPVHITSVRPGCECLLVKPLKELWQPGETGGVEVSFSLADQTGKQVRTIEVDCDDSPKRPIVLSLIVDIPEEVEIRPRLLFWKLGETGIRKTIDVKLLDPKISRVIGVRSNTPTFAAKLGGDEMTGVTRIEVVPADTGKSISGTLQVEVLVGKETRKFIVYCAVK